ncbi:hypothetical protein P692DRAFT_201785063 [Suillus brevipes Sb2]|nr:hypothetical protein P692DRAFT_201785063 [Suillus brevipes Sb2]
MTLNASLSSASQQIWMDREAIALGHKSCNDTNNFDKRSLKLIGSIKRRPLHHSYTGSSLNLAPWT